MCPGPGCPSQGRTATDPSGRQERNIDLYSDTLKRLDRRPLSEIVRDALIQLIATGTMKPGDRLNEVQLAESLGISRGPIREAARELEGQGFIISRPRLGFYIADFTAQEVDDLYEVKSWIDPAMISHFLGQPDNAAATFILRDIDSIDTSSKALFSETSFAYRQRIAGRITNRFLAEHVMVMYRRFYVLTAVNKIDDDSDHKRHILDTERAIWGAVVRGDGEAARAVAAQDVAFWRSEIVERFAKRPD